jgi:hypothetical protein
MARRSSKNTQYNGERAELQGQGNVGDVLDGIDGEVKRWSVVAYIPGVST